MTDQDLEQIRAVTRELDIREKLAHIDQMLADHDRKRQEIYFAPWQVWVTTLGGAAVFFAAGVAFVKIIGG
jgi:hypothetical protein